MKPSSPRRSAAKSRAARAASDGQPSNGGWNGELIHPAVRAAIRRKLLAWYDKHKRDLPWRRRAGDPYAQWVAEIMLQQTRVETVIRYYERFLDRFPDVGSLARADHDDVLSAWDGLGYYRRVLNLQRGAAALENAGAGIPVTTAGLRELPGVGEYTAAAIASIAFGEAIAAVDGNVARVAARLFRVEADILSSVGRKQVGAIAAQLVPSSRPGDFNQAWMDLASLVCIPRSPRCDVCPLSACCRSKRDGVVDRLPVRGVGGDRAVRSVHIVVGVFVANGRVLLRRRPQGGIWAGLWEPPSAEFGGRGRLSGFRGLAAESGVTPEGSRTWLPVVEHRLTHRLLHLHGVRAELEDGARVRETASKRWVEPGGLGDFAVPVGLRKVLKVAGL